MGDDTRRSRIAEVDSHRATGKTRRLFQQVRARLGMVPNLIRVNIFINHINHVANPPIDFPEVKKSDK